MKRISIFLFIPTIGVQVAWASDLPKNIKLFITAPYETKLEFSRAPESIDLELFDFSLMERIETSLSENLSDNPKIAAQQAAGRIEDNMDELKKNFRTAVETQILAEKFGILRLPAAVIDDSTVIYGTTDIDEILLIWKSFRNP